ncbi:hypothetical protein OQA88_4163 [Cercophora sp. LCS_1]
MHPVPSLVEAPPKSETPHPGQQQHTNGESPSPNHNVPNGSRENHGSQADGNPAPIRKDTNSSTTSAATTVATLATLASNESATTGFSGGQSPGFASQAVFSVADGTAVEPQRRASRRRTGPLTAAQREKAALIRKLGACSDCRRRRVACHPNHHGMSWEDATRKFRPNSPSVQDLAPLNGQHAISPASLNPKRVFTQDPQEMDKMDVDVSPTQQQPGRPQLSEARIRTPLPSGPRPDKLPNMMSLPPIDSSKAADIQAVASRILSNPWRGRYASATALSVYWQDDDDPGAHSAMEELGKVLQNYYNYTFQIKAIPVSSDGCKNPFRWLSREVTDLIGNQDQRDVLKIVYYNGHSYLDGNREMVLSSPKNTEPTSAIRWSGIQSVLENASSSDTLIIMDSAYYPSSKLVRQEGVLELIAASTGEDHLKLLDRSAFTRILTDELKTRASQKHLNALSAAELHAKLVSLYPRMIQDRNPEKEILTSFPSPFHLQMSGNARLPSILLAPLQKSTLPYTPDSPSGGTHMTLTFRLPSEDLNPESWAEFFRWVPEGVRDIKVEGPYRNTFR